MLAMNLEGFEGAGNEPEGLEEDDDKSGDFEKSGLNWMVG